MTKLFGGIGQLTLSTQVQLRQTVSYLSMCEISMCLLRFLWFKTNRSLDSKHSAKDKFDLVLAAVVAQQ